MICEIHGIEEKEIFFPWSNEAVHMCSKCAEECEKESLAREMRSKKEEEILRKIDMRIEPMYYDSTFDTFTADTDEQIKNKTTVMTLVSMKSGKIVMLGNNGTGKTHLAVAALQELGGAIYTMYEISTRIRATYTNRASESEIDVVDELAHLPMLVIDEIGRTKGSDSEMNWLSYIIDKRHTRGLPLILITNKHDMKTCKDGGCADCIENYIGKDIMSRLSEDGILLRFSGQDYRKRKK